MSFEVFNNHKGIFSFDKLIPSIMEKLVILKEKLDEHDIMFS
jgi:hypothetical protein|tara:strand:+ start:50 stop:175 length:126 start_codon:yes stop_codon:yes gene_type:complete